MSKDIKEVLELLRQTIEAQTQMLNLLRETILAARNPLYVLSPPIAPSPIVPMIFPDPRPTLIPTAPGWPPFSPAMPYVGDPPFGSTTICGGTVPMCKTVVEATC